MVFSGIHPYGTPGGTDDPNIPQSPPDTRVANARGVILFLRVNGPISNQVRTQIEDVVRVLDISGAPLNPSDNPIYTLENGVQIDIDTQSMDWLDGMTATSLTGNAVLLEIPTGAVAAALIIGEGIDTVKLLDGTIDAGLIPDGVISTAKVIDAAITPDKLSLDYLEPGETPGPNPAMLKAVTRVDLSGGLIVVTHDIGTANPSRNILPAGFSLTIPNDGVIYDVVIRAWVSIWTNITPTPNVAFVLRAYSNSGLTTVLRTAYDLTPHNNQWPALYWVGDWMPFYYEMTIPNQQNITIYPALMATLAGGTIGGSTYRAGHYCEITAHPRVNV